METVVEPLGKYREVLKTYTNTFEKQLKNESLMTFWLKTLPDDHPVIIGKENNIIVGWACGATSDWYELGYTEEIYGETTCLVSVYVAKEYRCKGYGFQLGKELFDLVKRQNYNRILMDFQTKGGRIMYKRLCSYLKTKRPPFTPSSLHDKDWKMVKIK